MNMMVSAYSYLKENEDLIEAYPKDEMQLEFPDQFADIVNVGIGHNIMLDLAINQKDKIGAIKRKLSEEEKMIVDSEEFIQSYNSLIAKYSSLDVDSYISNDDPASMVMKLFLDIYNRYPDKKEDVVFIINKYIQVIEQSEVMTDQEKEAIYTGLSVAAFSFDYWEKNYEREAIDF